MLKIRVPSTSANLGPGFDCLGLALSLYDEFVIEPSDAMRFQNVEPRFQNEENLFVKAFRTGEKEFGGAGKPLSFSVTFQTGIPIARGLGSSAALVVGGLAAAQMLFRGDLNKDELFRLAAPMEGHPDNAAPCVYGGLTASGLGLDGQYQTVKLTLSHAFCFTLLIPDFEVETARARAVMPETYPRKTAASCAGRAVWMVQALSSGRMDLLQEAARDEIHEPYRRRLIPHFDDIKKAAEDDTQGALVISGSGSSCLLISQKKLSETAQETIRKVPGGWSVVPVKPDLDGVQAILA